MKYCKARLHESTSQGRHTTYNYVTLADIVEFHGQTFTQQWQFFASKKKPLSINEQPAYYYMDYKDCALTTELYMQ